MHIRSVWKTLFGALAVAILTGAPGCGPASTPDVHNKPGSVATVKDYAHMTQIMNSAGSRLLVVDLFAVWCRPCQLLAPVMDSLAVSNAGRAAFYRVDVDQNPEIATLFHTSAIPFVVFVKDQKVVAALRGFEPRHSYEQLIDACGQSAAACDSVQNSLQPF